MRHFKLRFVKANATPEELEFHAEDPLVAFEIARKKGGDRKVELWEGPKRLGTMTAVNDGLWQLD